MGPGGETALHRWSARGDRAVTGSGRRQRDRGPQPAGRQAEPGGVPDFPVVLSLAGRRCLVVGSGPLAARKARSLLEAGADLTVVAPEVSEEMVGTADAAGGARIERRPYRAGEASAYEFVVAATGDAEVDRAVTDDGLGGGALVNGAADRRLGSVRLPAVHRDGPVTVAVSTGGRSPALARWVRDRLATAPLPDLGRLCEVVASARAALRHEGAVPGGTVDWLTAIDRAVPLVESGRLEDARRLLVEDLRGGR